MGKKIREVRQARGWTLEKLEEASGVAVGTLSALETRDSSRSQYFPQIAKALGFSMEVMQNATDAELNKMVHSGDSTSAVGAVVERARREADEAFDAPMFSRAGPRAAEAPSGYGLEMIYAWDHPDDLPPGEFVMVPRLDVHLSAGGGRDQVEIELTKDNPQAFRAEWIRLMKLKPAKLAAMRASGDSMEPTIHDGDSLLIDTSQIDPQDGKVYALWYDGGERVKRLYRLPGGGLRIKSDNAGYGMIELGPDYSGHVRIIGRVVHRSGTGGL